MTSNKLMMIAVVFAIGAMGFVDVNASDVTGEQDKEVAWKLPWGDI